MNITIPFKKPVDFRWLLLTRNAHFLCIFWKYIGINNFFCLSYRPKNLKSGWLIAKSHSKTAPSGRKFSPAGKIHQSERDRIRTCNQWLKRTESGLRFFHPMSCLYYPVFWTTSKTSTLDASFFIKVESTPLHPMDFPNHCMHRYLILPHLMLQRLWFSVVELGRR